MSFEKVLFNKSYSFVFQKQEKKTEKNYFFTLICVIYNKDFGDDYFKKTVKQKPYYYY